MRCFIIALALCFAITPASAELPRRALLGITMPAESQRGEGAVVGDVAPGGTADGLGVQSGDAILRINDRPVTRPNEAGTVIATLLGGAPVALTVRRGTEELTLRGTAVGRALESYENARTDYGAVPFRGGQLRDILVVPDGVAEPPIVFLLQGFSCATIETPLYARLIEALLRDGIGFYRVEKAGVGDSDGGVRCAEIDFATELDGFRAAYRQLIEQRGIDPDRIFMLGHSLGGIQAPFLAAELAPRGVAVYGAGLRNWADYNLDVVRFQPFLIFGEDPATAAENAERYRETLNRFYFGREAPTAIADGDEASAQALRGSVAWDGGVNTFGRHYSFTQDLAHLQLIRAWRDSQTNVLAIYGEADLIALFPEDHRVIADIADHLRPGSGRYAEIAQTGHGMDVVGDRLEFRRRTMEAGTIPTGELNPEIAQLLSTWIRESLARPAWRHQAPPASD